MASVVLLFFQMPDLSSTDHFPDTAPFRNYCPFPGQASDSIMRQFKIFPNTKNNPYICTRFRTNVIGEMLEWLKRHAWKACIRQNRISGSNPDLSAHQKTRFISERVFFLKQALQSLVAVPHSRHYTLPTWLIDILTQAPQMSK